MVKLIIFDCDGVLVDSEALVCRVVAETLSSIGIPLAAEDIYKYIGVPGLNMIANIEKEYDVTLPGDIRKTLRGNSVEVFKKDLLPIAGVGDVLDGLSIAYCVASNSGSDYLESALTVTRLHDRCAPNIFSADMVDKGKPAPDLFLYAAERMNTAAEDCLVIEDSINGVKAAVAAGMPVFGFTGGTHCGPDHDQILTDHGADRIFNDMRYLIDLAAMPNSVWETRS